MTKKTDYLSLLESVPIFTEALQRCYLLAGKSITERRP